jgi:uroporphyrin-III C-methyltransferase
LRTGIKAKVCLVGAGPGDPELLTVKAAERLRMADVVLHDALVSAEVLRLVSPRARVINAGKRCGAKGITQAEIHRLLIDFARRGNFVVRLKGGDPLLFGRAGEELEALRAADIEVEIVPGITSALAAAAVAQISFTGRRAGEQIVFISGHRADGKPEPASWDQISSRTTVVVYMPGEHAKIAAKLMRSGFERGTPCIVISKASLPNACSYRTNIEELIRSPVLPPPSLLIIGKTLSTPVVDKFQPLPRTGC